MNITKNSVKNIVNYIIDDKQDIELSEYSEEYKFFNIYFDTHFKEIKQNYYQKLPIYSNRIDNFLPTWMINRLIVIDKLDSLSKFGKKNLINFFKKKTIINFY